LHSGTEKLSFILIFTWTLEKNKNSWRSAMSETLVVALTLMTVMSILALLVGGMIGWMARQHSYETTPQVVYTHPEMFDANGQLVPDEILALRIETHDTDEENDD
jgi:hypothetical protein